MGLITKEVEVKLWGQTVKYYNELGYIGKHGDIVTVKVEDLPKGSHIYVDVLCDYCKEEVFSTAYFHYNDEAKCVKKHACKNCWQKKNEDIIIAKYGVKNISQLKNVQIKREETFEKNYGVRNPLQSNKIKEKQLQTVLNMYGVDNISQLKEIKERKMKTTLQNYGVSSPSKSEEVKEKIRMTNLQKYGVEYTMQSPEIRKKANETLCKNGTQKTSKQQLYLHSLYGGEINYPISYYATDICFPEEKLVIEYDGGGHDLRVTLGRITQEEFDRKEIIRSAVIKREGYKQMRIISTTDLLPQDDVLLQMLTQAKEYFSTYPEHSWYEYNIDASTVRNAEHKEGVFFDYGELRKITEVA